MAYNLDNLHVTLIEGEAGKIIAYSEEYPEVIAQGSSKEDATERLLRGIATRLNQV